jgi:Ycf66 protein N-terminus
VINVAFGWVSLLGIAQILGALGYLALSIGQIIAAMRSNNANNIALRVLQLLLGPLILLISGMILVFSGWRLDPILQFQEFSLTILIAYLIVQDIRRL